MWETHPSGSFDEHLQPQVRVNSTMLNSMPLASTSGALSPRSTWGITADSSQAGYSPAAAFDNNPATIFSFRMVSPAHAIAACRHHRHDGASWTTVATGTFADDTTLKQADFVDASVRYVRFTAITEAGGWGPWMSAAEIDILAGCASTPNALSPESTWVITADSSQAGYSPAAAFDNNLAKSFIQNDLPSSCHCHMLSLLT